MLDGCCVSGRLLVINILFFVIIVLSKNGFVISVVFVNITVEKIIVIVFVN